MNELGFDSFFEEQYKAFEVEFEIARVISVHKDICFLKKDDKEISGRVSGSFRHNKNKSEFPVVGDWVLFKYSDDLAYIYEILERKSALRKSSSDKRNNENLKYRVIVSNIDTVFTVMGLDQNYNLRRLERMLTMVWDSGANPVIVLTKKDLCENINEVLLEIEELALDVDIIVINSMTQEGYDNLNDYLKPGQTICLLGSSGAGKSTITNNLLGYRSQETKDVRVKDSKGMHTTTTRELFILDNQAMIIDTPGMREFGIAALEKESVEDTFSDIAELEDQCKFRNCKHITEPGCAILKAVDEKQIDEKRYQGFLKQKKEQEYCEDKDKYNSDKEKFFKGVRKNIKQLKKRKEQKS